MCETRSSSYQLALVTVPSTIYHETRVETDKVGWEQQRRIANRGKFGRRFCSSIVVSHVYRVFFIHTNISNTTEQHVGIRHVVSGEVSIQYIYSLSYISTLQPSTRDPVHISCNANEIILWMCSVASMKYGNGYINRMEANRWRETIHRITEWYARWTKNTWRRRGKWWPKLRT